MQELNFDHTLELIRAKDSRYEADAYHFVREALEHTQKQVTRQNRSQPRHVSGQELLEGIRDFALSQFGPMAIMVFEEWGVKNCEDFGEIVFNMVEIGLLGKTETDSRADFQKGYDFETAFRKPFLPTSRLPEEPVATKPERS